MKTNGSVTAPIDEPPGDGAPQEERDKYYENIPEALPYHRIQRQDEFLFISVERHTHFWGWLGKLLDDMDVEPDASFEGSWHEYSVEPDTFAAVGRGPTVMVFIGDSKVQLAFYESRPSTEVLFRHVESRDSKTDNS